MSKTKSEHQTSKRIILDYFQELEQADLDSISNIIGKYTAADYRWRGVYPFRELSGAEEAGEHFWKPLMKSIRQIQRRQDIFMAGYNEITDNSEIWVMSMGHFMGLFDYEWLGIRPTGKMINLRYAEFNKIDNEKIKETGLFLDLIGFMVQAGVNPLPPSTGNYFVYPGPRTHDGLLLEDAPERESERTLRLVDEMIQDLSELNDSGAMGCPPKLLEKTWAKDMIWYGPAGIGASYTIPRYQLQHQLPFRQNLGSKKFIGHECRFAEGNYACFFGWPNLSNKPLGGFLGLPGGNVRAEMQVVDVYRREGNKLAENWVFIDIPFWLKQQGLDIFERTSTVTNPKFYQQDENN